MSRPKTFDFAIVLDGIPELTDQLANALYCAGCADCTPSMRAGQVWLSFSRHGQTFDKAIDNALADVKRSGIGGTVAFIHRDLT